MVISVLVDTISEKSRKVTVSKPDGGETALEGTPEWGGSRRRLKFCGSREPFWGGHPRASLSPELITELINRVP